MNGANKTQKERLALILEGMASTLDISGRFYFNSYQRYDPNQNLQIIWRNVGDHFDKAVSKYESTQKELVHK